MIVILEDDKGHEFAINSNHVIKIFPYPQNDKVNIYFVDGTSCTAKGSIKEIASKLNLASSPFMR